MYQGQNRNMKKSRQNLTSVKEKIYKKSDLKNGKLTVTEVMVIMSSESQRSSNSTGGDFTLMPTERD